MADDARDIGTRAKYLVSAVRDSNYDNAVAAEVLDYLLGRPSGACGTFERCMV